jgi:hypothetical protein
MHSDPPLSQSDLISLLTLGFVTEGQDETSQYRPNITDPNSQAANAGGQFGGALITDSLGINHSIEDKLGVKVDVSSTYDTVDQTTKPTVTLRKQWTPNFGTTASREIGKTNVNDVNAEYKLNKRISVLGEWEGRDSNGTADPTVQQTTQPDSLFGIDLQYKMEFK